MQSGRGYNYYARDGRASSKVTRRREAELLTDELADPPPENPDRILLQERKRHLAGWLDRLPRSGIHVLDVGGRLQPYRAMLKDRMERYIGLDPQLEGLVDVVGFGEALPFRDSCFDLLICSQTLSYSTHPRRMVAEMYRVLKPGGALFLTAPAFFPEHHDENWRFLPGGLRLLLAGWSSVEILPEGNSAVGALRTIAILVNSNAQGGYQSSVIRRVSIRCLNGIARAMNSRPGSTWMTANYSVWSVK